MFKFARIQGWQVRRSFSTGRTVLNSSPYRRDAPRRSESIFMMVLVGAVSSELMYIIRLRNEKDRLSLEYKTKSKILDRLIVRAEAGEKIDIDQELMIPEQTDSLEEILKAIEQTDSQWQAAQAVPKSPDVSRSRSTSTSTSSSNQTPKGTPGSTGSDGPSASRFI